MEKFLFFVDVHYGYERKAGHKVPLHDNRALSVMLKFAKDFKPDHIVAGGDILDCGAVSHHNNGKPGAVEGFRLLSDAKELRETVLKPLEALKPKSLTYITGNHERFLDDLTERIPGLEGIVDVNSVLQLTPRWNLIPLGGVHTLGKLNFIHGDQLRGGEHVAKQAVIDFEKSIRFGHFHSFSVYTKTSALENKLPHTGINVPCLCRKFPKYGKSQPNRWAQGFLYGYVGAGGYYNDYVAVITDGQAIIEGKLYKA